MKYEDKKQIIKELEDKYLNTVTVHTFEPAAPYVNKRKQEGYDEASLFYQKIIKNILSELDTHILDNVFNAGRSIGHNTKDIATPSSK